MHLTTKNILTNASALSRFVSEVFHEGLPRTKATFPPLNLEPLTAPQNGAPSRLSASRLLLSAPPLSSTLLSPAVAARRPPPHSPCRWCCSRYQWIRAPRRAPRPNRGQRTARICDASCPRPSPGIGCAMRGNNCSPPLVRTGGTSSPSERRLASLRCQGNNKGLSGSSDDRGCRRCSSPSFYNEHIAYAHSGCVACCLFHLVDRDDHAAGTKHTALVEKSVTVAIVPVCQLMHGRVVV